MDDAIRFGPPLRRVQLAAAVGTTLVVAAFSWASGQWWRMAIAVVVSPLLLFIARRLIAREQTDAEPPLLGFFGCVFAAQATVVALTGGLASPLLVLWGGMGWVAGYTIGRFRSLLSVLVVPVGVMVLWAAWPRAQMLIALPQSRATHVCVVATAVLTVAFMLGYGGKLGAEIRRAQDALRRSALTAQRAVAEGLREHNETLLTMTGAVAHELKNPLSAVLALSTLLEGRARDEQRPEAEQLRVMASEARRMKAILDELLNFSRPGDVLSMQRVPLGPLVEELQLVHLGLAKEHAARFELRGDVEAEVHADRRKLSQILTNLMQNALDASPKGGVVETHIRALGQEGVEVSISDQGAGILPDVRGRLFVPGVSGKVAGSGLGLAISRMLAERCGGSLRIEDAPGGGCRSVLRLPIGRNEVN